jgi:hypothetical protein
VTTASANGSQAVIDSALRASARFAEIAANGRARSEEIGMHLGRIEERCRQVMTEGASKNLLVMQISERLRVMESELEALRSTLEMVAETAQSCAITLGDSDSQIERAINSIGQMIGLPAIAPATQTIAPVAPVMDVVRPRATVIPQVARQPVPTPSSFTLDPGRGRVSPNDLDHQLFGPSVDEPPLPSLAAG